MKRRDVMKWLLTLPAAQLLAETDPTLQFQFCMLALGPDWNTRERALVKLCFEIQKRCNIPIENQARSCTINQVLDVGSPFFIVSGAQPLPEITTHQADLLRTALNAGGLLLFDCFADANDDRFYRSAIKMMQKVFPELGPPQKIPNDHTIFQSYYLLKEARGRTNRTNYLEGWTRGNRTLAFFSHNDLLGALETDSLGNWSNNMEIGGGFRRELCFRLAINLTYYTLTLNYKKDRAFPPVIERRRRQ